MSKEFRQRGFRCELLRDLRQLARSHDKATQHWNFNKAAGTWSTWSSERRGWHRTRVARWLYLSPSSCQLLFLMEPPPRLSFSNSTGARVSCAAHGTPAPIISWLTEDGAPVSDIPGLR
ncbi:hypothetical protein SFRURICE_017774 [Spodoptera frugiperda]|nr:hypothetical protein SFRURICE_017774 [Spodoptera frugiperda]